LVIGATSDRSLIYITIKSKQIVIVGAGIAGAGLAYRLAQRGIETVPISSEGGENTPTISRKSATSVINRRLMEDTAIATDNPELKDMVRRYVHQKFTELLQLIHFIPFEYALMPRHVTPTPRNRFWLTVNPLIKIMTNVMGQIMTFVTCGKIRNQLLM
jgi:choline dehydrogenase-like flavoprotein